MKNIAIPRSVFGFFLFGVTGITTEIFFTALYHLYFALAEGGTPDWGLKGFSYIWMFPIYGSGSFLMKYLYPLIIRYALPIRLAIYVVGIFTVEYITGFILDQVTGKCPWEYHSPYAVSGYINLAYTPFWALFGLALELLFNTMTTYEKAKQ